MESVVSGSVRALGTISSLSQLPPSCFSSNAAAGDLLKKKRHHRSDIEDSREFYILERKVTCPPMPHTPCSVVPRTPCSSVPRTSCPPMPCTPCSVVRRTPCPSVPPVPHAPPYAVPHVPQYPVPHAPHPPYLMFRSAPAARIPYIGIRSRNCVFDLDDVSYLNVQYLDFNIRYYIDIGISARIIKNFKRIVSVILGDVRMRYHSVGYQSFHLSHKR